MSDQITPTDGSQATHYVGFVINNIFVNQIGATDRMFSWLMSNPTFVSVSSIHEQLVVNQTTYDSDKKVFQVNTTETPIIVSAPELDSVPEVDAPDSGVMHYLAAIINKDVVDIMGVDDELYRNILQNPIFVNVTGISSKLYYGETKYDAKNNQFVNPDNTILPVPEVGNIALLG